VVVKGCEHGTSWVWGNMGTKNKGEKESPGTKGPMKNLKPGGDYGGGDLPWTGFYWDSVEVGGEVFKGGPKKA